LNKTLLPQTHRLFEFQQGKTIGIGKRRGHMKQAMTITIGLDHRKSLAARRIAFDLAVVVLQGFGMDGCENGARHFQGLRKRKRRLYLAAPHTTYYSAAHAVRFVYVV
jgi:hypothetical protein